jgi:ABC-type uncharacterized transport system permease subunit
MKQKVFRTLADLRFSIFILLLISCCSILGTIIEQDQTIETYKINYPLSSPIFGFLSWVMFAGLLIARWRVGLRGLTAVRWVLGSFAVLLMAYVGSRFVLEVLIQR